MFLRRKMMRRYVRVVYVMALLVAMALALSANFKWG
jgi:hypothetical protein